MLGMLTRQHQPFKAALPNFLLHIRLATKLSKTINKSELAWQKYKYIVLPADTDWY